MTKQINLNGKIISLDDVVARPKEFLKGISGMAGEKNLVPKKDETDADVAKRLFAKLHRNKDLRVAPENKEPQSSASLMARTNSLAVDILLKISEVFMQSNTSDDRLSTEMVRALKDLNSAAAKVVKITSAASIQSPNGNVSPKTE